MGIAGNLIPCVPVPSKMGASARWIHRDRNRARMRGWGKVGKWDTGLGELEKSQLE